MPKICADAGEPEKEKAQDRGREGEIGIHKVALVFGKKYWVNATPRTHPQRKATGATKLNQVDQAVQKKKTRKRKADEKREKENMRAIGRSVHTDVHWGSGRTFPSLPYLTSRP